MVSPVTAFPNGVSSYGIPVLGSGPIFSTGNVYFVHNSGSNNNSGIDPGRPLATLDAAVNKCTANNGDTIVVMPNHAESLAADSAVDIDVAGVTVIGMGVGENRPTFTFITLTTADFKLAAADVKVQNLLFKAGIDALTGPIEISGDDCKLLNCEYRDDAANNYETIDVIVTTGTPLRMEIGGFVYHSDGDLGGASPQQSIIQLNGADHAWIHHCWLVAFAATGVIEDATVSDSVLIEDCVIENQETSPTVAVLLQGTTSGTMRRCHIRVASGTTYLTAANDMQFFESYGVGTDADSGDIVGASLSGSVDGKLDIIDEFHDVPAADNVLNAQINEVIGNKADAPAAGAVTSTDTIVGYLKQLINHNSGIGAVENTRLGVKVSKAAADLLDGTLQGLFTIAGGRVLVTALYGEVSVANVDAGACNTQWVHNPTVGTDLNLSAVLDIDGDELGTVYSLTGEVGTAMTGGSGGGATGMLAPLILPEGDVSISTAADRGTGGALFEAELWFIPLDVGATVTAV
jgi:hypothetical protein